MKHGDRIRLEILNAGLEVWPDVTLSNVARAAGLKTHAAVSYHFPADKLKDLVAEHAVETGHSAIIVQLIGAGHPSIKSLTERQRSAHLRNIQKSART